MPASMWISIAKPSGYAGVRFVAVSVPFITALIEPGGRYRLPSDMPPPAAPTRTDPSRSRGPNMRTMVRRALERAEADDARAWIRRIG
jgi:hypothetical protein